ncbi:peptidoglycan editing factor PgeF [Sorangium atrum]|uniref:Purine nucleoside phosphorylase n=1 Tax=Sorangium atrum TaxID=2995308 RepID=A0ABT5C4E8_9BACT|nr:peptidoglycan editing factor PgeF [Sorangium aterium]MDC0680061.1 peptidoglycan editing factor PgeF [Sorangium aterium]
MTVKIDAPGTAEALESPLLAAAGFSHAFFTRRGGVSAPPWDTLSFAIALGDDPAAVRENLERAARRLGIPAARLYFLSQVHGVEARVLTGEEDRDDVVREVGDVTLSHVPGVGCGVRSADCAPILLADRRTGAVAAVHSGWRGTVRRVVVEAARALRSLAGPGAELVAAIGPHIEACCFEVGDDVAADLAACSSAGAAAVVRGAPGARPHVDVRRILKAQLTEVGLDATSVEDVPGCTACDPARFFSYRRDGQRSGRLLSVIVAGRTVIG